MQRRSPLALGAAALASPALAQATFPETHVPLLANMHLPVRTPGRASANAFPCASRMRRSWWRAGSTVPRARSCSGISMSEPAGARMMAATLKE
jgi:hypothetical protein